MDNTLSIENAIILFRNFSGREDRYNRKGDRNFCVRLAARDAGRLREDGWNVKTLPARSDDEEEAFYLKVKVSYKAVPPRIYICTRRGKTLLDEESVDQLDYADIASADIIVRPYRYDVNGKTGISAYVKTMYVTLDEDVFASKYDLDDPVDENGHLPF